MLARCSDIRSAGRKRGDDEGQLTLPDCRISSVLKRNLFDTRVEDQLRTMMEGISRLCHESVHHQ